jgi:hypothetical protein
MPEVVGTFLSTELRCERSVSNLASGTQDRKQSPSGAGDLRRLSYCPDRRRLPRELDRQDCEFARAGNGACRIVVHDTNHIRPGNDYLIETDRC